MFLIVHLFQYWIIIEKKKTDANTLAHSRIALLCRKTLFEIWSHLQWINEIKYRKYIKIVEQFVWFKLFPFSNFSFKIKCCLAEIVVCVNMCTFSSCSHKITKFKKNKNWFWSNTFPHRNSVYNANKSEYYFKLGERTMCDKENSLCKWIYTIRSTHITWAENTFWTNRSFNLNISRAY